jgi:hypothetical protein
MSHHSKPKKKKVKGSAGGDSFERLLNASRKLSTSKVRAPWRHRKHNTIKLTPAQKKIKQQRRKEEREAYSEALTKAQEVIHEQAVLLREQFGKHSVEYYKQEIMQMSRLTGEKKAISPWHAFLKQECDRINSGEHSGFADVCLIHADCEAELPSGERRKKVNELMPEISAKWREMSAEEKVSSTQATMEEMEELREMKELSRHNVLLSAFHDTRRTIEIIAAEVNDPLPLLRD